MTWAEFWDFQWMRLALVVPLGVCLFLATGLWLALSASADRRKARGTAPDPREPRT